MNFADAFAFVIGQEGGLSMDAGDKGNWTGGKVNVGTLKGTKYGISAAAYPAEDIPNLTLDRARFLAKRDYWDKFSGDALPYPIALGMFDCGYNEGPAEAARLAQKTLGLAVDGVVGRATIAGLLTCSVPKFARKFCINRIVAYASLAYWVEDHDGWVGRVLDVYQQMIMSSSKSA